MRSLSRKPNKHADHGSNCCWGVVLVCDRFKVEVEDFELSRCVLKRIKLLLLFAKKNCIPQQNVCYLVESLFRLKTYRLLNHPTTHHLNVQLSIVNRFVWHLELQFFQFAVNVVNISPKPVDWKTEKICINTKE